MNLYSEEPEYLVAESERIHPMANQPAYSGRISMDQVVVDLKDLLTQVQELQDTSVSIISSLQVLVLSLQDLE